MTSLEDGASDPAPELELPIIDAHMHVVPPRRLAGLMRWAHRFMPTHPVPKDVTAEGVISDSEKFGTRYFFNLVYPLNPLETESLNNFNFELTKKMPNCVGWGSVHPENEDRAGIIERAITEQEFIGIKLHPFVQDFSILDPRLEPVYKTLAGLKRPLFIHTGYDEFYQQKMPPSDVRKIATDYPDMPVIISHMLFPKLAEAFALMEETPSIIGDLTNVPGTIKMIAGFGKGGSIADSEACRILKDSAPKLADRLIFGSDHPAGAGGYEDIYRDLMEMELPREVVRAATWDNALRMVKKYLPERWAEAEFSSNS